MSNNTSQPLIDSEDQNDLEDDHIRTGTLWTATTHAVTAVIGSGVLAIPWSVAQMGWIFGPLALFFFAYATYYTAVLLCDCYRSPDPVRGRRNRTYVEAVRSCLGPRDVFLCALVQYAMLWGSLVGYTITAAMSMMTVERSHCLQNHDVDRESGTCRSSGNKYLVLFGLAEVVLSQFENLEKITLISLMAAVMSFTYSLVGLCLCVAKFASHGFVGGSFFGPPASTGAPSRVWHGFQALGNIAFAYSYAIVLVEIQDTVRSPPPENRTMKKASGYGIGVTAVFYVLLGFFGYAAFGDGAPGNVLTGFEHPFWLVDVGNLAVVVHLVGAYQVYGQPIFAKYEELLGSKLPDSSFVHRVHTLRLAKFKWTFTPCKVVLRAFFVILTTVVAMIFPFFNAVVGLLGSLSFWPLTVYFPVTMYIAQARITRGEPKWVVLQSLSVVAFLVSVAAGIGSVADIGQRIQKAAFFRIEM